MTPYFIPRGIEKMDKGFTFRFHPKCCVPLKELGRKGRSIEAVHEIRDMLDREGKAEILDLFRVAYVGEDKEGKVKELGEALAETEKVAGEYIEGSEFVQETVVADLFKRALRGFERGMGIRDASRSITEALEDEKISPEHESTIKKLEMLEKKMEAFMAQEQRESRQK